MAAKPLTLQDRLPPEVGLWLNEICDRFEAAWRAGRRPRLEDYLGEAAGFRRAVLVRELILLDIDYRRQQGETPLPEEYRSWFVAALPSWLVGAGTPLEAAGRYRLLGEVARGGMGVVYRAFDPDLDREVAVKVLHENWIDSPEAKRRFLEEAHVAARLQHPGLVSVHERGELPDGRPFFAMKLIEGRTLGELLGERRSPADELPRFLQVFGQVCQAVGYAHSKGVIHRDLKPGNVMVGAFGEVQVMDWGLAKMLPDGEIEPDPHSVDGVAEEPVCLMNTPPVSEPGQGTQAGTVLGTYPYIAPEQARGQVDRLDERCDVFSLGAILCEILTGKQPYTGSTSEEVRGQAEAAELGAAWARLDGCGADADLVRLAKACLAANRGARPRSAQAVAEAATAYQTAVEQRLRQAELERAASQARAEEARATAAAERRARRRTVELALAVLLLGLGGAGTVLWWTWQRLEQARTSKAQIQAIDEDLEEVKSHLLASRLHEAEKAMERAGGRPAQGRLADLSDRVQRMREHLTLMGLLDWIRLKNATAVGDRFDNASADRDYALLFQEYGLAAEAEDPTLVADRIQSSPIRVQLVAALDDWALATGNSARRVWLLAVARQADPGKWSDGFRDATVWGNKALLEELARNAPVEELTPQLLITLAEALKAQRGDAVPLLTEAQGRHPADFWLNVQLANALRKAKPEEAAGYYRVALALRPNNPGIYNNLGQALQGQGRWAEAITHYRKAIDLNPRLAPAYNNLGTIWATQGKVEEAIQQYRKAIELDPRLPGPYNNLGIVLQNQGKVQEAVAFYQKAVALDPGLAQAQDNLGVAWQAQGLLLLSQGRVEEGVAHYQKAMTHHQKAIAHDPRYAKAYNNLGSALQRQGKLEEAIEYYRKAIALDPGVARVHNNLGVALYDQGLASRDPGMVEEAITCYRKAIALDPRYATAYSNLGHASSHLGKVKEAIEYYRKAIALDPRKAVTHYNLGHTLGALGEVEEAITSYQQAITLDPGYAEAYCNLGLILQSQGKLAEALCCLLRGHQLGSCQPGWTNPSEQWVRQCQRLLQLQGSLPDILAGKAAPASESERLEYASLCSLLEEHAAAARLYAAAFAAKSGLAEDLEAGHRYNAACAAVRGAARQGKDAIKLTDKEQAHLRQQALVWLRGDLNAWKRQQAFQAAAEVLDQWQAHPLQRALRALAFPGLAPAMRQTLHQWRQDPDLASIRDRPALANLPDDERHAWRQLWVEVDQLLK